MAKIEGAIDFTLYGKKSESGDISATVGLRFGYDVLNTAKDGAGFGFKLDNLSNITLAADVTLKFSDDLGINGHLRKYIIDPGSKFSWKDLAAKDWIIGGQLNFGKFRPRGRFNISNWAAGKINGN